MILLGASGHAKVILDTLSSMGIMVEGLYDDDQNKAKFKGFDIIGPISKAGLRRGKCIISIGDNEIRKRIAQINGDLEFGNAIHPNATISESVSIGTGTVVMPGVVVNTDTEIGEHCIINTSCSIDHDCMIESFAHISPNATLAGNVSVGEGAHIGAGSVVIPGIKIGKWSKVGAGAVVIRDVADFETVVGNPAQPLKNEPIEKLFIIGAGGFGRELKSYLPDLPFSFAGFMDDNRLKEGVLGSLEEIDSIPDLANSAIAIGSSETRIRIANSIPGNLTFPNIVHPKALLADEVIMGLGNIITPNVIITSNVQIGNFCLINLGCTLGHDVTLGNFCSLMPGVNLGGNVILEEGVFIGTGATVLPGVRIGKNAVVGAGAVVTRDVPAGITVKGVPAK